MAVAGMLLGFLAGIGTCVALLPLFNALNCITLPLALLGFIVSLAAWMRHRSLEKRSYLALAALVLNGLVLLVGTARMLVSLVTTGGIV